MSRSTLALMLFAAVFAACGAGGEKQPAKQSTDANPTGSPPAPVQGQQAQPQMEPMQALVVLYQAAEMAALPRVGKPGELTDAVVDAAAERLKRLIEEGEKSVAQRRGDAEKKEEK